MTALSLAAAQARLGRPGRPRKPKLDAAPPVPLCPKLLDVEAAAAYMHVSVWTIRDLVAAGTLTRVRIPLPGGRELRRLLVDREELDGLILVWKEPGQ